MRKFEIEVYDIEEAFFGTLLEMEDKEEAVKAFANCLEVENKEDFMIDFLGCHDESFEIVSDAIRGVCELDCGFHYVRT